MQTDSSSLQQIISHFYSKSFHIIVGSRVPSLHSLDTGGLSSSSRSKKIDKWFNLLLGDQPAALDKLNYWRTNLMDLMTIDIVLVREGTSSSTRTVIERWIVQYECPTQALALKTGDNNTCDRKKAYKKSIVLFRSVYSQMRLLPAHRIFRRLSKSRNSCNFDITYELTSFSDPFSRAEEEMMEEYNFKAVEAFPGRFCISVTYLSALSNLNLDFSTPLPPKLIKEYVGSPNTSPLMPFSCREKGVDHHHSWTSAFHKAAITQVGSSRSCLRTSDFPTDGFGNSIPNYPNVTPRRSTSYNEYRPSTFPPSPSPSHSHSLSKNDGSSLQKSSFGIRSSRKIDYGVQKIVRDNEDDSGRFFGLLSSSSSQRIGFSRRSRKSSFQDDSDYSDFSCPFDVDDVDISGVKPSQNVCNKNASKALPMVRKSEDAEIGVLVHMLRAAPPLHQDPSCVPSQSLATASGLPMLRKTDDALEELRSYRKMRDVLLSKS